MKLWKIVLFLCLPASLWAQGSRFDGNVFTAAKNVPPGAQAPVYTLPFSTVVVCPGVVSCTAMTATLYTDQALTVPLPSGVPITSNAQGEFGFWAASATYTYTITSPSGATVGSYNITLGGGASGVPSVNGITNAVTVACAAPLLCTTSGTTITISQATAFTINSFTGCAGALELGAHQVNPAFSATYSTTPGSAAITNTDSISSPTNLTSPYTSGTVSGTFTHNSIATTTFTLTAVGSSTQTASCNDTWNPRIFGGVGTPGATSSVTASGTTAVLSTSDVLSSLQLGAETVGQVFGPFTPNNQDIYLLLTGGSHTFVDNATGFTIPFNSPIAVTFVNANGTSVSMFLYSTTFQSGPGITANVRVAS